MSLENLILIKNILYVLIPLLTVIAVMVANWRSGMEKAGDAGRDFAGRILRRSKLNYFNYESIQKYLNSKGAVYMFGEAATPVTYMLIKVILAVLFLLAGISLGGFLVGLLFAVVSFFFPDILLTISNAADNDAMLNDIKCIYDTLRIQTKAGVFLTSSLSECYLAVRHGRLKSALLELTNDISTRREVEDALERFNEKFDCGQIDIFCIVIKQSLESGRSVKVLEDLSMQMNDLQHAINLKEKEALDRKVQIVELLIFIGLLAVTLYALGVEIISSVSLF